MHRRSNAVGFYHRLLTCIFFGICIRQETYSVHEKPLLMRLVLSGRREGGRHYAERGQPPTRETTDPPARVPSGRHQHPLILTEASDRVHTPRAALSRLVSSTPGPRQEI